MKALHIIIASILCSTIVSCSIETKTTNKKKLSITGCRWELINLYGKAVDTTDHFKPYIEFKTDTTFEQGNGRTIELGNYRIVEDSIILFNHTCGSAIMHTVANKEQERQSNAYINFIFGFVTINIRGDSLIVYDRDGYAIHRQAPIQ